MPRNFATSPRSLILKREFTLKFTQARNFGELEVEKIRVVVEEDDEVVFPMQCDDWEWPAQVQMHQVQWVSGTRLLEREERFVRVFSNYARSTALKRCVCLEALVKHILHYRGKLMSND
jgi:hypothetical protein